MKIQELLETTAAQIEPLGDTPQLDAQVLLAHCIQKPRTWLMAHPEYALTKKEQDQLTDALEKLSAGEPLPYVLGKWEFFGLEFEITNDVLIPHLRCAHPCNGYFI